MTDHAIEIRRGEEINVGRLSEYLREKLHISGVELTVAQFPAGSSNLTYLVTISGDEFVLRRPPFGNTVKTAHDMSREFRVLSKLSAVYSPAPKPLLYCDDESVIGSEFYLMERRNGLIIRGRISDVEARTLVRAKSRRNDPNSLKDSKDFRLKVCKTFIQNLADLHALDYTAVGLADLGHPEGYARRQVEGWTKRYFAAKTNEHAELESVIKWLNESIPNDSGATLVHNDYKFDNIMLDPADLTRITAVLDWEMVTIGDPLMDFGTTLGYWMSPDAGDEMLNMPFNPRVLMENISRRELAEMYAKASERDVSNILYYYIFGTLKIAVIAQQIYARYVKGFTKDERFANFDRFVSALGKIGARAIHEQQV